MVFQALFFRVFGMDSLTIPPNSCLTSTHFSINPNIINHFEGYFLKKTIFNPANLYALC